MRRLHLTVLLLAAASMPAWSTTVYKWVDDAGIVHFSDTPRPGAVKLEIGSPQTYAAPAATPSVGTASAAHIPAAVTNCTIDSPTSDQVFMDVNSVSGHATVSALKPGETATMTLDGAPVSDLGTGGGFQLSVERGTHTVALAVTGADGAVHCQSSVTFHVRQQSRIPPPATTPTAPGVLNPNRPRS